MQQNIILPEIFIEYYYELLLFYFITITTVLKVINKMIGFRLSLSTHVSHPDNISDMKSHRPKSRIYE